MVDPPIQQSKRKLYSNGQPTNINKTKESYNINKAKESYTVMVNPNINKTKESYTVMVDPPISTKQKKVIQ